MFQWAINGPEVSKMVTLPVGVTVMGRQPGVDILLEHPLVSRRHAQVVTTPTTCELTDLGSSNGTRLNGRALPANTPTYLHHNDVVEMGPFKIVVGVTAVAVEPEPEPELEPELEPEKEKEASVPITPSPAHPITPTPPP
ncbi:MAG: FHA domain-containing protein, partial [Chloroflexi bacterium]|nr:FHA domain-containing protein [Chloroflexota bacterium]